MQHFIIDVHGKILMRGTKDDLEQYVGSDDNWYLISEEEVESYNIVTTDGTIVTGTEEFEEAKKVIKQEESPDLLIYAVEG